MNEHEKSCRRTHSTQVHTTVHVVYGTKPAAKQYLNQAEEEELSEYTVTVGKTGFGKICKQIKNIVEKVVIEKEVLTKTR